jgi:hypothetical protein
MASWVGAILAPLAVSMVPGPKKPEGKETPTEL